MPLTSAQLEFINASIDHLLDFPPDNDELTAGIEQLKACAKQPPADVDDNNIFQILARCIRSPETSFQRIEDYSDKATIQDVQQHVLSLITMALASAVKSANTSLAAIGWNITTTAELLGDQPPETTFKSVKVDYLPSWPWINIREEGCDYTCSLSFNSTRSQVQIHSTFHATGNPDSITFTDDLPVTLPTDYDESDFLQLMIPKAKKYCRHYAASMLLTQLRHLNLITNADIAGCLQQQKMHVLLADTTIATLLLTQKITFSQLSRLTDKQKRSLSHPTAKLLVQSGSYPLEKTAAIHQSTLAVMQMYASLIQKKTVNITHFCQLTSTQKVLLKHPVIVNLIHKNNIDITTALTLPKNILPLLNSTLYGDYFLSTTVEWEKFRHIRKKHVTLLLNPLISTCIKDGVITLNQIIFSNKRRRKQLRLQRILSLLANNTLTVQQLDHLPITQCQLIDTHPMLSHWLKQGIVTANDMTLSTLKSLYLTVYTNRLRAILHNRPYLLSNGSPDSLPFILTELPLAESHACSETDSLSDCMMEYAISLIKRKIIATCQADTRPDTKKPLHLKLHLHISRTEIRYQTSQTLFTSIVTEANKLNNHRHIGSTFFGSRHQDKDEFNQLCQQLTQWDIAFKSAQATVNHRDFQPRVG